MLTYVPLQEPPGRPSHFEFKSAREKLFALSFPSKTLPRILAILVGVTLGLFLIEGFFRINAAADLLAPLHRNVPAAPLDTEQSLQLREKVRAFRWRPIVPYSEVKPRSRPDLDPSERGQIPCCSEGGRIVPEGTQIGRMYTKAGHRLVYSAKYTFDDHSRRRTPNPPKPKYNILLFGDSYVLGEGVSDEEAAPTRLAGLRQSARVFNLGISGAGPNLMLRELELPDSSRLRDVAKVKTIVVYVFDAYHLERLFFPSTCMVSLQDWMLESPYYENEGGEAVFKGTFREGRPGRNFFYWVLNQSAALRFFGLGWPLAYRDADYEFFASVVDHARDRSRKLFSDAEFIMVMYPVVHPNERGGFLRRVKEAVEAKGIKVLDYTSLDLSLITDSRNQIPLEGHPSPVTQFLFANLLNRDLPDPR